MNPINHPDHYGGETNPFETIKIIEALGWGDDFCLGNALKYIMRAGKKSGVGMREDLEKAIWYLKRVLDRLPKEPIDEGKRLVVAVTPEEYEELSRPLVPIGEFNPADPSTFHPSYEPT